MPSNLSISMAGNLNLLKSTDVCWKRMLPLINAQLILVIMRALLAFCFSNEIVCQSCFVSYCSLSSNLFIFVVLKHVYIPLLFFSGVDYIDAPTPYMMGLHSGVDTSYLAMDGVSSFYIMFFILVYFIFLISYWYSYYSNTWLWHILIIFVH